MAIKRIMGIENEYGIIGNSNKVLENYKGKRKEHENKSETNNSAIPGLVDTGHIGGDYQGQQINSEVAKKMGFVPLIETPIMVKKEVPEITPKSIGFLSEAGYVDLSDDGFYGSYYPRYGIGTNATAYSQYFGRDDMLANGARFYIDMGHPEYSTPECSNPLAAVLADKAGERILEQASESGKIARIFKNNSDNELNSFGTHENYLLDRKKVKDFAGVARFIAPFLISRIIYTGSGKIGLRNGAKSLEIKKATQEILEKYDSLKELTKDPEMYNAVRTGLEQVIGDVSKDEFIFQMSQRADFFEKPLGIETTFNRPIVNTRDEALSDQNKYMRLHVITGDANLSEVAGYLKIGTMALILDLFEDGKLRTLNIDDPVSAFHNISRDILFKSRTPVKKFGEMTAIEIQRYYQQAAESVYRGRDKMTDDILNRWKFVLNTLETDPMKLDRQIDWIIKKRLIDSYMNKSGKNLGDAAVRNIDLMYHEVNRKTGFFYLLQNKGLVDRLLTDEQIEHAMNNAPEDTRAWTRGELIKNYEISSSDWDEISIKGQTEDIALKDPLKATKAEMQGIFNKSKDSDALIENMKNAGYIKKPVSSLKNFFGFGRKRKQYKIKPTKFRPK